MKPRLVKSQREMEGRFEDVWVLVDEDDEVESWPEDAELDVVGKPATRLDGPVRTSGAAHYTVDVALPGMLHALILRAHVARARLTGLDVEAARATPGVRAVLGPGDATAMGGDPVLTDEPGWAGAPIAAVAADTPDAAAAGLAALAPAYETLAPLEVDGGLEEQRFTEEPRETVRGDPDAGLAAADARIELTCETPAHVQSPLEPHAAVARWDGDSLTAWVSTQGMFDARRELARRFGLLTEQVRVISEFIGGGFGAKQGAGVEALLAAELARATGRPVRLALGRHEEQVVGGRRAWTRQTVTLGARSDGTLTGIELAAVVAMGAGGWIFPVAEPALSIYACPNVRTMVFPVRTSLRAQNAFRAPGVVEGVTVLEQAIDELAGALGMDPLELRRANHVDRDQGSGLPYSSKRLLACYDRASELAGWAARDALREPQADGLLRGMGCASQIWWGGGGPPAHATVRLDSEARALVTTGIQDIGTGTLTSARIVAAEELGLPLAHVVARGGDTAPNLYGPVAGGSMTTPAVMPAVRSAAGKVRRILLSLAADVLEIAAADLTISDGRIRSRDGALDVDVVEVTGKLGNATIDGTGARGPNPDGFRVNTFGCQIAQVAVDPGTGVVAVERVVAVHDVGRIVNPLAASSQAEGGVIQGIGYALSEELVVDPTTGMPVNGHLDDYKVPTIADMPEILVDFPNVADPNLPNLGAKGLGEPPIVPTAAAIANAFAHATGRRAAALPLTPARVLEVLA
ncbi:MAG TPA: xanthine dehydrogenase family protein molybdopterin-binding subunit [Gaiella sp.]|jgi:xanthine dehydrogenase YagR molybdenum-binding subunit|nr:xanthine dehydrogenase family protein molybdopterin-binding subunit [Gaiella sp.]